MNGGDEVPTTSTAARPSWNWVIGSSALAVGLIAFFFPVAPLWTIIGLVIVALILRFTRVGARWVQDERSAMFTGLVNHPAMLRHHNLVAATLFILPLLVLPGVAWALSGPSVQWNGGAMWIVALFGFVVFAIAQEQRAAGMKARWWQAWVVFASVMAVFLVVGGPARLRWAYCESRLTRVVSRGDEVTEENTGRFCWHDVPQKVVDGQTRLYTEDGEGDSLDGKGLVYSPDRAIELTGGIRLLIDLGDGWYWFETGTTVRSFWLDG